MLNILIYLRLNLVSFRVDVSHCLGNDKSMQVYVIENITD